MLIILSLPPHTSPSPCILHPLLDVSRRFVSPVRLFILHLLLEAPKSRGICLPAGCCAPSALSGPAHSNDGGDSPLLAGLRCG